MKAISKLHFVEFWKKSFKIIFGNQERYYCENFSVHYVLPRNIRPFPLGNQSLTIAAEVFSSVRFLHHIGDGVCKTTF